MEVLLWEFGLTVISSFPEKTVLCREVSDIKDVRCKGFHCKWTDIVCFGRSTFVKKLKTCVKILVYIYIYIYIILYYSILYYIYIETFIEIFIEATRNEINNEIEKTKRPNYSNLSLKEQKALQELQSRDDIVIREADKSGAVVILDEEGYITIPIMIQSAR